MLLRNLNKNHIIFNYEGNEYYENIDNDNKLNVFDENLMNIYLEKFQDTIGNVTYNNITKISILENHDENIYNLPDNLKILIIMSSFCHNLILKKNNKKTIEIIHIDNSNITHLPDIKDCEKLRCLKINHASLKSFNIDYDLPDTLEELNLSNNLIKNDKNMFSYEKIIDKLDKKTLKKISFSDNHLIYDNFPEKLAFKSNLVRQGTYRYNRITRKNVGIINIQNNVQNINGNLHDHINTTKNAFFSSQNVHLSSINKSVLNSIKNIEIYVKKNNIKVFKLKIKDTSDKYFSDDKTQKYFDIFCSNNNYTECELRKNFNLTTENTITKYTYKQTFELIWSVLCDKFQKKELDIDDTFERLNVEINDGIGLCFTGKYNRLINSLVGIVDCVQIGYSKSEQIQLEMGKVIEKINDKNNKEEFNDIICYAKSILENIDDGNKNAWLEALYDLAPYPTKIQYDGCEYYKTWDYEILDIYGKILVGYYFEEEKNIVFLKNLI